MADRKLWNLAILSGLILLLTLQSEVTANFDRFKRAPPPVGQGVAQEPHIGSLNTNVNDNHPEGDLKAVINDGIKPGGVVEEKKKKEHMKIAESEECAEDVQRFCAERAKSNNFLILDCLQDDEKTQNKLSETCHHFLWTYKVKLSKDIRFDHASNEACSPELAKIPECNILQPGEGEIIPCLIEHYEEIKSKPCTTFLNKMASIIFSDYRFMKFFMKDCKSDIETHKCGRLETAGEEDDSPHSQGYTVKCLTENRRDLSKKCKKSLLRVAELQSDDYHMDRALYYACKTDRENLCSKVVSGNGAVFKCLFQQLGNTMLSGECRQRLEARQELVAEDVKVDKSFYEACSRDIRKNNCFGHQTGDSNLEEDLGRTTVLLCLEQAQNEGKKVDPGCLQEMFELRSELMQDYKISPEVVDACKVEIDTFCDGLEPGGNTIQCLMKEAVADEKKKFKMHKGNEDEFSAACKAQIGALLHVAGPGEDIRLDRPLQRACGDVVTAACADRKAGHGDVITCLLENLDHEDMTDDCEDRLLEIQYFAVRDFQLDVHLFKECRKDAKTLCHNDGYGKPDDMTPQMGPLIFACLHRAMRSEHPKDKKPSRPCMHEVRRVLKERSMRVELIPEVEDVCMRELSDLCSSDEEHTEVGGEMECLQMNLDDLGPTCKEAVANFTEEEEEDIEMDRILMKACTPMIEKFCKGLLVSDVMPNEVLQCLIEHKNYKDMDEKCAAGIEHHQIISLKDFRFNHKFREACQESVQRYCKNKRTKYDVVACLSEHVRNDTLKERDQRIGERCQKQLKFEFLQRGESIKLDTEMEQQCKDDIDKFCGNKRAGEGEIEECLKSHKKRLSNSCHKLLFQREKDEVMFGDYTLHHTCKLMIKEHCDVNSDEAGIFECLREKKDLNEFDHRCRQVVIRRIIERSNDFRLNPHLHKSCHLDIGKFCTQVFDEKKNPNPEELEGQVIDCLKKTYASKKSLTKDCEQEVKSRIKEAALDINVNPVLMKACKKDIAKLCIEEVAGVKHMGVEEGDEAGYNVFGEGKIVECLKKNFRGLQEPECRKEVAFTIAESRIDVHVDPQLSSVCQKDLLTLCKDIPQGQGRQMACLLTYLESSPDAMTRLCRDMLKRRKDLWESAAQVAPAESFAELYDQISTSPSRNYFIAILFTVIGVIFIVGLTCGRVTKRVRAELKNK